MKHNEFALRILDGIQRRLGSNLPGAEIIRVALDYAPTIELRPQAVVNLVKRIAPRYKCDLTQTLPVHDPDALAEQLTGIFIIFGRAHARNCPTCDNNQGAIAVLARFLNTQIVLEAFGEIPQDMPMREHLFFLDEESDYTVRDDSDHSLRGERLRDAIKNWNVTGNQ